MPRENVRFTHLDTPFSALAAPGRPPAVARLGQAWAVQKAAVLPEAYRVESPVAVPDVVHLARARVPAARSVAAWVGWAAGSR
jgi:hypothetical protein